MTSLLYVGWGAVLGIVFAFILCFSLFKPITDLLTTSHDWIPAIKPDRSKQMTCYVCRGDGNITINSHAYPCATCGGRGWIATAQHEDESDDD